MKKLRSEELERTSPEKALEANKLPIVIILDGLRSAHNVGSIFRSCDAFLVEELMLCGITPCPPHREISKTALGATTSVKWNKYESALEAVRRAKKMGFNTLAIEHTDSSEQLHRVNIDQDSKLALVFGNEVNGISNECLEHCDSAVEIPMYGSKHSFNVSVSAGIVLWEVWKSMQGQL